MLACVEGKKIIRRITANEHHGRISVLLSLKSSILHSKRNCSIEGWVTRVADVDGRVQLIWMGHAKHHFGDGFCAFVQLVHTTLARDRTTMGTVLLQSKVQRKIEY